MSFEKKKYEVWAERPDEEPSRQPYARFESFSDEEAKLMFYRDYVSRMDLSWDCIRLIQVIQERKTRDVEVSNPKDRR